MFFFTSLTTLASVLFYGWLGFRVGQARTTFKVAAPRSPAIPCSSGIIASR